MDHSRDIERAASHRPTAWPAVEFRVAADKWSDAALSIWAKTEDGGGDGFLPLVQHLIDAADVAGELWDHWLSPNVRRVISDCLPGGEEDGRRLVRWSAGIHDIGKAAPGFAVKARMRPEVAYLVDRMAKAGLQCSPYKSGGGQYLPPHGLMGHYFVREWLQNQSNATLSRVDALAVAIGGHHGVPPTYLDLDNLRGNPWLAADDPAWKAARLEILDRVAQETGVDNRMQAWLTQPPLTSPAQALVSSVVIVADWLASDQTRFPLGPATADRLRAAGLGADLLSPWVTPAPMGTAAEIFSRRFPEITGAEVSEVQQAAYELARDTHGACLMIIEAPMGSGKTEAALMAAEVLANNTGSGGVFFALPTMATSDAMFGRMLSWVEHLDPGTHSSVFLAHGKARLNEQYRGLDRSNRFHPVDEFESQTHGSSTTATVASWLNGRHKGVLATMVVGTIDQTLFGALKTRFLALRHLALAGKVVIIDEVHAADAFMSQYLEMVLEWLGAYGAPVILLSATLPPALRQRLLAAYASGRQSPKPAIDPTDAYPRITIHADSTTTRSLQWSGRTLTIDVRPIDDSPDQLVARVRDLVDKGACVVVIRNTVSRAQQTYDDLVDVVGVDRIMLLHSRFVAVDRAAREERLRNYLGRNGSQRPRGYVVVGTQVLEQSLDIDADVMFTDLAPVDLVLQRAGRLHRHQRGPGEIERPAAVRHPILFVTGIRSWSAAPPVFDRGSEAVYGSRSLLRAAHVLRPYLDGAPLKLPADISRLVKQAYDSATCGPQTWSDEWERAEIEYKSKRLDQEDRAGQFRIRRPRSRKEPTLVGWVQGFTNNDDEQQSGRAQVRDSEDGIEVIVVQRDSTGSVRVLDIGGPESGRDLGYVSQGPPSDELAMVVASYTVRLPASLTPPYQIDAVISDLEYQARDFVSWQSTKWLAGLLILCLDENLSAEVNGHVLRYDAQRGLLVEKGTNRGD